MEEKEGEEEKEKEEPVSLLSLRAARLRACGEQSWDGSAVKKVNIHHARKQTHARPGMHTHIHTHTRKLTSCRWLIHSQTSVMFNQQERAVVNWKQAQKWQNTGLKTHTHTHAHARYPETQACKSAARHVHGPAISAACWFPSSPFQLGWWKPVYTSTRLPLPVAWVCVCVCTRARVDRSYSAIGDVDGWSFKPWQPVWGLKEAHLEASGAVMLCRPARLLLEIAAELQHLRLALNLEWWAQSEGSKKLDKTHTHTQREGERRGGGGQARAALTAHATADHLSFPSSAVPALSPSLEISVPN